MSDFRPSRPDERDGGDATIDRLLRRGLEPERATVERVIARARVDATRGAARHHRLWIPAAGVAAMVAVVALTLALAGPWSRFGGRPAAPADATPATAPAASAAATDGSARLTISNVDGPITVTTPAGSRWIILPREGAPL